MHLRPMTDAEYEAWHDRAIEAYAMDIARASGEPVEAARTRAHAQDAQLLPDGRHTEGTWLMNICDDDGAVVGILWLGRHSQRPESAYVYDIEIDESRRGEGLGRAAMQAAEDLARDAGLHEIGLNVFGFNDVAQRLYTSLDYRVVATSMSKTLD